MDTITSVVTIASIGAVMLLAAGLHSRYLQARLKQARGRDVPHYRARTRSMH